jgi:hypothetical protein
MDAVASRATPKSMIFTVPSVQMKMLAGLMSRWTMPAWCAWSSPASTCTSTDSFRSSERAGGVRITRWRSCPLSSSIAMNGDPSVCDPRSNTVTTLGCVILATALASRVKRSMVEGSSAMDEAISLSATSRSSTVSWAT